MTHRLLSRQLRRHLGIQDADQLSDALAELARACSDAPRAKQLIEGLVEFLPRVDAAYEQSDRDLELARRSLEISSRELTQVNDRLREEGLLRDRALELLRNTANGLLGRLHRHIEPNEGLQTLPQHLDALTSDLLATRQALDKTLSDLSNRQFAVDQHAIVSMTDAQGRITYANDLFCQITGYSQEELIGQDHRIVNSGIHEAAFFQDMWQTIQAGSVWHGQICNRSRSGELHWLAATIVPILDGAGKPYEYVAIRTDITAQKQLKDHLRQERRFLQSVMDTVGEGLYSIDAQGRCTYVNREAERLLGWRREEMDGRNMHDLIHYQNYTHDPVSQAECHIFQSIRDGHVHQSEDDYFTRKDGTIFPVALIASPLLEDGKAIGSVVAFSDITERKRVENEMRLAKEAAEQANRAKSDFLATMSHEIRTPMNGIIGMTDLALDTELSREQREYLGLVKNSADSLLDIINDILDFSKIEAGRVELEHIPYCLSDLVATALGPLGIRARQKNIELICVLDPAIPPSLLGDPGRLRQILVNLVGNSIKFSQHGDIEIRAEVAHRDADQLQLHFSVRDQGIGIAAEKQKNIFDPFTQADTSTTRRFGGTGLGLAICARLVRAMGGTISVDSTLGSGSTFHFTLNCGVDLSQTAAPSTQAATVLAGVPILVVDDNIANRSMLVDQLTLWGMQVESASDGASALSALASARDRGTPLRCVLLDASMPELDGFEVAERMRAANLDQTEIVMMIAVGGNIGDAERCAMLGLDHYLSKPLRTDALLHMMLQLNARQHDVKPVPQKQVPLSAAPPVSDSPQCALDVLLAEDNAVNQHLALTLLQKHGHRVKLAVDGKQAVAMFDRHHFDVILMDVQMPEIDGLEATRLIRARELAAGDGRHTRIVAMTANAMSGDREACLAAGMDDYVAKPLKPGELNNKLRAAASATMPPSPPGPSAGAARPDLTPPPGATGTFDYLAALRYGDKLMIEVMGKSFCRHRPQQIANLRDAAAQGDRKNLLDGAITLKNLLGHFRAAPAQSLTRELELLAAQGDFSQVPACLARLSTEITKLEAALMEFIGVPN